MKWQMNPSALEIYVARVIRSCRTQVQLGNAYRWALNVLAIWARRENYAPLAVTAMTRSIIHATEASANRLAREGRE